VYVIEKEDACPVLHFPPKVLYVNILFKYIIYGVVIMSLNSCSRDGGPREVTGALAASGDSRGLQARVFARIARDRIAVKIIYSNESNAGMLVGGSRVSAKYKTGDRNFSFEDVAGDSLSSADYFRYPKEFNLLPPREAGHRAHPEALEYLVEREIEAKDIVPGSDIEISVNGTILEDIATMKELHLTFIGKIVVP